MVRLRSPAPKSLEQPTVALRKLNMGEFPSGQRGQTVNLLSLTSVVRIHLPPPEKALAKASAFSVKSACVGINPLSWMKSFQDEICLAAGYGEADLISSEAVRRRFHPNSFGFHPAKLDFIKFIRLAWIIFVLASLFYFSQ